MKKSITKKQFDELNEKERKTYNDWWHKTNPLLSSAPRFDIEEMIEFLDETLIKIEFATFEDEETKYGVYTHTPEDDYVIELEILIQVASWDELVNALFDAVKCKIRKD